MKITLYYLLVGILFLAGVGLFTLFNQGILDFNQPYARNLPQRLGDHNPVVAFVNVNVVPMDSERILDDQTVVVRDGAIESIGSSGQIEVPAEALIVDGRGKYLMPGLVDMHVHVTNENELFLFVAHGVTSVRNLWGGLNGADHLGWRAKIEAGEMFGPTLYTAGPIMEGPPKTVPWMQVYEDPESAAEAVNQQIDQGYDFIKVYDYISLPVYEAVIETAQARGVMVVGHTPRKVGLERVLNSGQVTIEHISGFIDADAGEYGVPESELPTYAKMAAADGVYICPTIAVYQLYVPDEDLHLLVERPEMDLVSPRTKFMWKYLQRPGSMGNVTYQGDYPARINEMFLNVTRILHEHGVKFILGTDTNNPYLVPGASLFDELDYLVEAGFSPYEALETGTRNAAEAMGKSDEFGTIEVGKRADLILLENNPLLDVSNIQNRSGVMVRGRWLTNEQLQSMLDGLVESYKPNLVERLWPLGLMALSIYMIVRKARRTSREQ
ncbi:MAG: amidohydrolase family protein [Chloroflexi bacterium]|nr:amidohydrolase family protein [Chloroflexota bacterium]